MDRLYQGHLYTFLEDCENCSGTGGPEEDAVPVIEMCLPYICELDVVLCKSGYGVCDRGRCAACGRGDSGTCDRSGCGTCGASCKVCAVFVARCW
jgi:hypothetical protein